MNKLQPKANFTYLENSKHEYDNIKILSMEMLRNGIRQALDQTIHKTPAINKVSHEHTVL